MKFSDRCNTIDSSGIRKVFDLAATLKDPCNLSIGLPDYDIPDPVKEVAVKAIHNGHNRYTQTAGVPKLREKVKKMYEDKGLPAEDVMIASGTSGGLYLSFLATLNPGDGAMFTDPYFVMYKQLINFIGAIPQFINSYPDFRLTREKLEAAYTPASKMLILNSPNNPTGISYSEEELRMAADFAEEKGLIVLSDEIYDAFSFDGDYLSPAKFTNPERTLIVSGLSKTLAMTGWRLGWVAGPKAAIKRMSDIQQYTFVCAPSFAQAAAVEALDYDTSEINKEYTARRDLIYNGLKGIGIEVSKPNGAFYIFPKAPGGDGMAFVEKAVKKNLLIVPGNVFSEQNTNFRISFAASREQLERGLGILSELV